MTIDPSTIIKGSIAAKEVLPGTVNQLDKVGIELIKTVRLVFALVQLAAYLRVRLERRLKTWTDHMQTLR